MTCQLYSEGIGEITNIYDYLRAVFKWDSSRFSTYFDFYLGFLGWMILGSLIFWVQVIEHQLIEVIVAI